MQIHKRQCLKIDKSARLFLFKKISCPLIFTSSRISSQNLPCGLKIVEFFAKTARTPAPECLLIVLRSFWNMALKKSHNEAKEFSWMLPNDLVCRERERLPDFIMQGFPCSYLRTCKCLSFPPSYCYGDPWFPPPSSTLPSPSPVAVKPKGEGTFKKWCNY